MNASITKTVKLTGEDAQEVLHKIAVLADSEDLQADYDLTAQQAAELCDGIPHQGGDWTIPEWGVAAVCAEMENHSEVMADIARDARSGGEIGQSLRIAKQAKRLGEIFQLTP